MLHRILKAQRGFTLIELLAVIAILTVLSGIVAGAVTGIGTQGQNARLVADADTIGKAADQFFNEAFPQAYPVLPLEDPDGVGPLSGTPTDIRVAGDLGVRLVNFEAVLPGDPQKKFVPDFLKEVPGTAALVSWRAVTATGQVFFAEDGAQLVRPSTARLDVSAKDSNMSTPDDPLVTGDQAVAVTSDYTFKLRMNKNEAALEILGISIPAKYAIGGQTLNVGTAVGTLVGTLSADNPYSPGQVLAVNGTLKATGLSNEWELFVDYASTNTGRTNRTHKVSIATPSEEAVGAIKIEMDRNGDTAHNTATETWELTIYGGIARSVGGIIVSTAVASPTAVITNPSVKGVYRWPGAQFTTIDVGAAGQELFSSVTGNQAVVIKEATTTTVTNTAPVANGQSGLTATVNTPLTITLAGTDAESTSLTFTIVTDPTKGTLSALSGSGLSRTVTYTPTATGADSFTFKVNDGTVDSAVATVSITVALATLTITTTSLPAGAVGTAYTQTLAATAGTTPYSWVILSVSESSPTGLTISPVGSGAVISFTPTAPGTFSFTVQVTDNSSPVNQTDTQVLSITIT